jgi:hypothetical protein
LTCAREEIAGRLFFFFPQAKSTRRSFIAALIQGPTEVLPLEPNTNTAWVPVASAEELIFIRLWFELPYNNNNKKINNVYKKKITN